MAMVINNNQDAWISIGELNRNIKDTVREFEKIVSGQEINYASDDSAKYSVSEKMRTKIRALEQNQQNAKAGMLMLTMAQEGIQEQLDILKTIKTRAMQASDASANDEDRQWIQQEIDSGFQKINDIAYEIEHNGINLLTGNVPIRETTVGWKLLLTPQVLEDSDMHLIDDVYFQLDGLQGPFDAFSRYKSVDTPSQSLLQGNSSVNLSGGRDGTPAVFQMDFSGKNVSDLVGKAFQVRGVNARGTTSGFTNYAIVDSNSSTKYNTSGFNVITVNSATMSMSDALNAIASKINSVQSSNINAAVNGTSINFTPVNTQTESNNARIQGATSQDTYTGGVAGHEGANSTGLGLNSLKTSGGTNATYKTVHHDAYTDEKDRYHAAWDETVLDKPATQASLSFNVSNAAADSGFTFNGARIKLVTDPTDPDYANKTAGDGVTKIGLGWSGYFYTDRFRVDVSNGQFNITARGNGTGYNNYGISDGYSEVQSVPATLTSVGLQSLGGGSQISQGVDGQRATYDMDLTAYDSTDPDLLENFIDELLTGSLHLNNAQYASTSKKSTAYEFIDTVLPNAIEAKQRLEGSKTIDLNNLRTAVQNGTTIADAFINLMTRQNSAFSNASGNGQKILRTTAVAKGIFGNEESLNTTADQLSQYTLDFKSWLADNGSVALKNLTRYLDGKGFRFYCATDTEHWFNFVFTSGEDEADRPKGISGAHLETIPIDVSGLSDITPATDTDEVIRRLVETIYEQANPHLVDDDHNLYLAVNPEEGTITVYDERKEDVLLRPDIYPNVREAGAKIGDGVLDDVMKTTISVPANQRQLAIQHTDYSAQYILLHIPQTTVNHIFSLDPDWPDYSKFNITTQEGRDYLLGKTNSTSSSSALNKGLEYLFSALTTVAAQNSMLRHTETNLFTNYDNETAAESTIRDTDIAKSFVKFTKSNMLAKAAETMLAQANQNITKILELLDRSTKTDDDKDTDKKSDDKSADDKKSAATDKKSDDKKSSDKKKSDKKSALLGQIGSFASQRDKNSNKTSSDKKTDSKTSAQKNSTQKTSVQKTSTDKK